MVALVTPEVTKLEQEIAIAILQELSEMVSATIGEEAEPSDLRRTLAFMSAVLMEADPALSARSHFVKAGTSYGELVARLARYLREEFEWTGERLVEVQPIAGLPNT